MKRPNFLARLIKEKMGTPVRCDFCKRKRTLDNNWMMTTKQDIVCPNCIETARRKAYYLINLPEA